MELEIGTGKGTFLLGRARERPDRSFLGIEWANEFFRFAADRMDRWNVGNVRMMRTDAAAFLRTVCPRNSLAALHVYHPDPWPKKRHHKRRFFQPNNLDAAVACLVPGGRLAVQTDHEEYFEIIRGLISGHPGLSETAFNDPAFGVKNSALGTNFEVKYIREGRPIYQFAAIRRPGFTPPRTDGSTAIDPLTR